jgi:phospholipase/lecithinase/hemolysin
MPQYASSTDVSSDKSQQEIQRTLRRYGATRFMMGWSEDRAMIGFVIRQRQVRFLLPMPDPQAREFTHTPSKGLARSPAQREAEYEQAVRQRWRALNLVIKAKLEAVEAGIVDFDTEFLGQIVLPNNQTVAETVVPRMQEQLEGGSLELLPALEAPHG